MSEFLRPIEHIEVLYPRITLDDIHNIEELDDFELDKQSNDFYSLVTTISFGETPELNHAINIDSVQFERLKTIFGDLNTTTLTSLPEFDFDLNKLKFNDFALHCGNVSEIPQEDIDKFERNRVYLKYLQNAFRELDIERLTELSNELEDSTMVGVLICEAWIQRFDSPARELKDEIEIFTSYKYLGETQINYFIDKLDSVFPPALKLHFPYYYIDLKTDLLSNTDYEDYKIQLDELCLTYMDHKDLMLPIINMDRKHLDSPFRKIDQNILDLYEQNIGEENTELTIDETCAAIWYRIMNEIYWDLEELFDSEIQGKQLVGSLMNNINIPSKINFKFKDIYEEEIGNFLIEMRTAYPNFNELVSKLRLDKGSLSGQNNHSNIDGPPDEPDDIFDPFVGGLTPQEEDGVELEPI